MTTTFHGFATLTIACFGFAACEAGVDDRGITDPQAVPLADERPQFSDWSEPAHLGPEVNSAAVELFLGSDRPGPAPTPFDLWVATRASTSHPWSPPVKLGPSINGPSDDGSAALSFDGTTLYITSDRGGNADFWVSTRTKRRRMGM